MSLSVSERRTILIGGVIVALIVGYTWIWRPLRARSGSVGGDSLRDRQFADASARIRRYRQVSDELASLANKLNVELPETPPSNQMTTLVEELEKQAGSSRMAINNILRLKSRARQGVASGQEPVPLKLDLTCKNPPNFASVLRFLDRLESMKVPIAYNQISVTNTGGSSGRGGSSRGGSSGSGMQTTLQIHTYFFPEKVAQ
jgi:hypothetical protein